MTGGDLLVPVVAVEAAVLVAVYGLLTVTGARRALRRRRATPRLVRARAAVARVVASDDRREEDALAVRRLGPSLRAALFAGAASSFSGAARMRLAALAEDAGVTSRAERLCGALRWHRRLRGVRMLTLVGGGQGVVPPLLRDPHPEVRAAAATWAADSGQDPPIEGLLALLEDPEPLCRFMAKGALLRIGPSASEPLAAHLAQASGLAREGAMEVAVGLADPALLAAALHGARGSGPRERCLAARLAGAVGGEEAVAALEGMLSDPAPEVRAAAAAGLGSLGHWPAAAALGAALGDSAWDVRQASAHALVALGAPGLLLLRESLDHEDRFARDMARQVLDLPDTVRRTGGEA